MAVQRTDIERALDEIVSQEEGMRFQGLAVVLGKIRWPELIAHQRKKDGGLDAYAAASQTPEKIGKGLAASITGKIDKITGDLNSAKVMFPDLEMLLFVTSAKVGNAKRKNWEREIQKNYGIELHIIEREEIITLMLMPENSSLCASFLHLSGDTEPQISDLIEKSRRAANVVTQAWFDKTKGYPLMNLSAVRLDTDGSESSEVFSLEHIDKALSQSRRIVLEGPAGCGKSTTLIQLAILERIAGIPFIVELPAWISSRRGILEYIAGIPAFQAEGLTTTDIARVLQTEPFLLMLNGWNEIAQSNSVQANVTLRELERDFPGAGIIVATRTHHLTPPLPGALRLRLLSLRREQREDYLAARLGSDNIEICARIDADPSLDELTRTPFILSEVVSLFEAGVDIPSTRIGIIFEVLRLHEQREEHQNALQSAPIYGRQMDYMKALATEMTRRGAVALAEDDACAVTAHITRELVNRGQIEPVPAQAFLSTLTAHHVLERTDYPATAFHFGHQQLQEYYATLDLRARLFDLPENDSEAIASFTAEYVNNTAWAEPLRMIAETFTEQAGDGTDDRNTRAGARLVEIALAVDLVFAGDLAQLSGAAVWNAVRPAVNERFRRIYAFQDRHYQQYAVAAMLATGSDEFSDIILPLLSGDDHQTRLGTYQLWPDIRLSSLGPEWRDQVRGWSDEARADFVSELLHHRVDGEVADFAVEDRNIKVKQMAAYGLMWTGAYEMLIRVLESMDEPTFVGIAVNNVDRIPTTLRPRAAAAMRKFIDDTTSLEVRLRTALALIEAGETGLDGLIKDTLTALPGEGSHYLESQYVLQPALEYLREIDPAWISEWVAVQVADGILHGHEHWLPYATAIPDDLIERYLHRLETEDLNRVCIDGLVKVIITRADTTLAARVFTKLHELRSSVYLEPAQRHEFESQIMKQLKVLFRGLPDDLAAAGILSSVSPGDALDINLTAELLNRVGRLDVDPFNPSDDDLKAQLRAYLKGELDLVLSQDDFAGSEKSHLASSLAQIGNPEDMADLVRLIRADIERVRRGRAARAAGDHGPLGQGGAMSYATWHIAAVTHLDPAGSEQVLIDLLPEPEYCTDVATAMAREFLPKRESLFDRGLRYDLVWAAREGRIQPSGDDQRRRLYAAALNAEINCLRDQNQNRGVKELATALAAIDGLGFADIILDIIAMPIQWSEYTSLDAAERLLMAGVVLLQAPLFALVDSVLQRTERGMQDSDRHLLRRVLALCPFVDDPAAGFDKMREVLSRRRFRPHELREIVTALGESRSEDAIDLLHELASDPQVFSQFEDEFINALVTLDTPRAREQLLGFVDPDIHSIVPRRHMRRDNQLAGQIAELAERRPDVFARLKELSGRDLPEIHRHVLAMALGGLGTPDALFANLKLIDDTKRPPIPHGTWEHLQSTLIERRPYGQETNTFTQHARASNELRAQLFRMTIEDDKRRKSAFALLGQIEVWRLEYGRPINEPRHPNPASGQPWPPKEP